MILIEDFLVLEFENGEKYIYYNTYSSCNINKQYSNFKFRIIDSNVDRLEHVKHLLAQDKLLKMKYESDKFHIDFCFAFDEWRNPYMITHTYDYPKTRTYAFMMGIRLNNSDYDKLK